MSVELPSELTARLLERKALLWICQRAEIAPGHDAHADATPFEEAVLRYRTDPDPADLRLANVFWEACWTESIVDRFYDAINEVADGGSLVNPPPQKRLPYRLTTDPDTEGQIDRRRFLPIYEVNGTNRVGDPEGRHGGSLARRLAYKMGLIRRLESFPGRALIVLGARETDDLSTVRIALDFLPTNTVVAILWPSESPIPHDLELPSRLSVHFLRGTRTELVDELIKIGAPKHTVAPRLGIRCGRSTIDLAEEDLLGIDQEFVLIRDTDFEAITSSTEHEAHLERLWRLELGDWMPFASGKVFRRHYQPILESKLDTQEYVISELRQLAESNRVLNMTLTIPATSGSGITTALRHASFLAAKAGFPTLLCKPTSQRFSVEKLAAFLTRLQERGRDQHVGGEDTPALIVFDREHRGIEQVSELAATLASRGRRALVVEVVPPEREDSGDPPTRRPRGRHLIAREFRGLVDQDELRALSAHFSSLYGPLGLPIPSLSDWMAYQVRQTVHTPSGEQAPDSLFWIALRFFVGKGNPHFDLAQWVGRTYAERVTDPRAKLAIRYIAAFSSFGIAVPLVPLLRNADTTKTLDTSIMPILRDLSDTEDLLRWGDAEEYLHDQTISFKHRLIAVQLLKQLQVTAWDDRIRECWGLLETLEASPIADSWLVEALVFEALRLDRSDADMRGRLPVVLEAFDHIPSVIAARSASTQHHWGRALGLIARDSDDLPDSIVYFTQAIEKLASACELAESDRGREHPRNIYNSLGVMRSELSRALRRDGQLDRAETLWQSAASAFDLALRFGSDNFVALSAYAHRLIEHAREIGDPAQTLHEVATALSYLAQAEETALLGDSLSTEDASYLEFERNKAWQVVDPAKAERHIEELVNDGDEIGVILRAHGKLENMSKEDWQQGTAVQLEHAYDVLQQAQTTDLRNRSWRSVFLLYRVVSALRSRRYDFRLRLSLLDELDTFAFRWYAGLRFAQAVLCYQTGDFLRGFNLFRDLRSRITSGDLSPIRLTSFWRDLSYPSRPRQASVRIERVRSDWVAYGEVPEMNGQRVLARPRWFEVQPRTGDIRQCHIVFEINGPLAVPVDRRLNSLID